MREKFLRFYRREWPRVAVLQAMALGGASLLAGRKNQTNLRALAVMNAMTMCAHQYEEYVDPGYFPLGITQALAHGGMSVGIARDKSPARYSPGTLTAVLLHLPIGITYLRALRTQGPISRDDWIKTGLVLLFFAVVGVATPNVTLADKNSPYPFTEKQLGPYLTGTPEGAAGGTTA